ncbi:MAG: hypothetical protein M1405_01170 [Patescibacteria group bacterium]|nr:hypothetical protein [Patescibacteria group bacterium]
MLNFFKKYRYLLIEIGFIAFISLIPFLWFKPNHVILGLDSGYAVDFVLWLKQRIFTWLPSQNFGIDLSAEVGVVPYNALPAIIELLGVAHYFVQRVLLSLWFFIISISIYALTRYIFPKKEHWIIRLTAVLIYVFNFHLYSFFLQGEQPMLSSYVILPLFALLLLRFVRGKPSLIRTAIYLNFVYLFFGSGGVRGVPLIGPVILTSFAIFLFFFFVTSSKNRFDYLRKFLSLGICSGIFFIFFNAYFLFPFLISFSLQYGNQVAIAGGIDGAVNWAKFISTHTSFINLFRLQGDNNWYDNPYYWSYPYFTNPLLIVGSFMLPILAFLAPVFVKERKDKIIILFFAFLGLFGLFLSTGAHPPLGNIYVFLMERIPGFAAYRSGYYKFIPAVYLAFSILIGFSAYSIISKIRFKKASLLGIIFILLILLYHFPYFQNTNFNIDNPFNLMVKVPDYVLKFAQYENKLPDTYRTLVVPPPADAYNIKTYKWGYFGSYPIFPLITDRGFVINDQFVYNENENKLITSLYGSLQRDDLKSFLDTASTTNIKYILVTSDVAKDYFMSFTEDPSVFRSIINKNKDTFRLVWENGPWQLYEITSINPKKVEAFDSVTLSKAETSSIDSLFKADYIPFITSKGLPADLKVPIRGEFQDFSCASCHMLEDTQEVGITSPKIYPTSFLYPLKLKFENDLKKAVTEDEKMNALLGLTLKRTAELDKLNYVSVQSETDWLRASDLLYSYWMNIKILYNEKYKNSSNYATLRLISRYLTLERNIVSNIINIRDLKKENTRLGKSLSATLSEIQKIDKSLHEKLTETDWETNFVYDISSAYGQIFLNPNSLFRDAFNKPIYPIAYKINNTSYNYPQSDNKIFLQLPEDKKILTLTFSLPNLFNNPAEKTVEFNKETKRCLVSPIDNYSGMKRYVTNAKVAEENAGFIYVKRDYDIFKSQKSKTLPADFFNPEMEVGAYTGGTGNFIYQFRGSANDRKASIYFCTDKLLDPNVIFKDISVTELIHPQVYSYNNQSELQNKIPEITFSKIDPTNYKVTVKNATDPFILSFSERFSPLWEAEIGGKNIPEHFLLNGYANGWYVENKGTYVINLTFKPQRWLQIGVITSCFTIAGSIIYLLFAFFNHVKNKNK